MTNRRQIALEPEVKSLAKMRVLIEEVCQAAGIGSEVIHQIQLASDEACANIIEHGYAGLTPAPLQVRVEIDPRQVIVEISDSGHPFPPVEPPAPDAKALLASDREGGLGIYLMYRTMDEISYRTEDGINTLRMAKKLP